MLSYNSQSKIIDNNNNYIYSIDKIRLNCLVGLDCIEQFRSYFQSRMNIDSRISYYHTIRYAKYEHLWDIQCVDPDSSISVGAFLRLNVSTSDKSRRTCFVEFNPNKLTDSEFILIDEILMLFDTVSVVRVDLAVDIPDNRDYFRLVQDARKYSTELYQGSFTEYLGKRNSSNFVKLYNKQKESHLDYELTRLEISCEPFLSSFLDCCPVVIYSNTQLNLLLDLDELSPMARELILLCRRYADIDYSKDMLKRFNYRIRKKLEPYIFGDCRELAFNQGIIQSLFTWCKNCCTNKHFTPDSV